jgi:hypothetical protein
MKLEERRTGLFIMAQNGILCMNQGTVGRWLTQFMVYDYASAPVLEVNKCCPSA